MAEMKLTSDAALASAPPAGQGNGVTDLAKLGVRIGVDAQVLLAAQQIGEEQRKQPEWLWFADENTDAIPVARYSFGRWAKLEGQAPYIRADLVMPLLSAIPAPPGATERETEAPIYEAFARFVGSADERPSDFRMFATGYHAASAPPAPTPEAGSDLAGLSAGATPGPWYVESEKTDGTYGAGEDCSEGYDVSTICTEAERPYGFPGVLFESHNSTVGLIEEESDEDRLHAWDAVSKANAAFIVALVNAYRSGRLVAASASPPPGEDLAGQGEPVAWAWELAADFERAGAAVNYPEHYPPNYLDGWKHAHDCCATLLRQHAKQSGTPAPSRPADREEIARAIMRSRGTPDDLIEAHERRGSMGWRDAVRDADAVLSILALRDAPRNAGDGTQDRQGGGR